VTTFKALASNGSVSQRCTTLDSFSR